MQAIIETLEELLAEARDAQKHDQSSPRLMSLIGGLNHAKDCARAELNHRAAPPLPPSGSDTAAPEN